MSLDRLAKTVSGKMSHLRESPAIENSEVQDFIELIQVGLQGAAPTHHTLAHPKRPPDLPIHPLLRKPACHSQCESQGSDTASDSTKGAT